jgi:CheY-like chemotaxis protein
MRVRTAGSGQEAIDAIEHELPSLVVLDLTMPVTTGSDVARKVRSFGQPTPILLITGDGRAREKARAIGAYAYLQKPFEVADLLSAVERGLQPPSA